MRQEVQEAVSERPTARLTRVLDGLGLARSSWYEKPRPQREPKGPPGPPPKPIPGGIESAVLAMAMENPWYGYKRIAVMCRREDCQVTDRQAYRIMKAHDLLQKPRAREPELYQASKLFELLPSGPNELWQMDVTYVHIPSWGWWYAITVIDYYSRYLLTAHLTPSYSARDAVHALSQARREAERLCGPLAENPTLVTDNGPSFIARRFGAHVRDRYEHVRIRYRTPTQLGLLERFHRTLKEEEVYWRIYDNPQHARECLGEFRTRYNRHRPHWALRPPEGGDPGTPLEVYTGRQAVETPKWQPWARAARRKLQELMEVTA